MKVYKCCFLLLILAAITLQSCVTTAGNNHAVRTSSLVLDTMIKVIGNNLNLPSAETRAALLQNLNTAIIQLQNGTCGAAECATTDAIRLIDQTLKVLVKTENIKGYGDIQKTLIGQTTGDLILILKELKIILDDFPSQQSIRRMAELRDVLIGKETTDDVKYLLDQSLSSVDVNGTNILDHFLKTFDERFNMMLAKTFGTISTNGKTATDSLLCSVEAHGQKLSDILRVC